MTTAPRLAPDDVFRFVHAAEVAIAPVGRRVAQLQVRRDRATDARIAKLMLWTDGAGWQDIAETDGCSTLHWSPDGRRLAFLRRHKGTSSLLALDAATLDVQVVASSTAAMRELAWSPDSAQIAFQRFETAPPPAWLTLPTAPTGAAWAPPVTFTERLFYRHDTIGLLTEGAWQTCVVPSDGRAPPRQVTTGPWFSGFYHPPGLGWTPDGATLVLAANQRADWDRDLSDIAIQAIDVATGAVQRFTYEAGAQAMPAVSPDGRWLAYTAVIERKRSGQTRHAYLRDMQTGAVRPLLPGADRSVDSLAWTADSSALYLCSDGPGYRGLLRAGLDGSVSEPVTDLTSPGIEMPYQGGGFSLATDGTLAYLQGAIDCPGQVVTRAPDGTVRRLTTLNAELGGFRPAESLHVPASSDGAPIQAWLMLPPGTPPASGWPVLLEIHGGPYAAYGARFSIKHQMLAAAGYAVLFANPRGSVGYGEAFAMGLHDRFPGPDYDDLMDVLDAVVTRTDIDAGRQYITGVSGGGTLTLWAIGHTKRFRAAVSIKPVVAWESWLLTADIGTAVGRTWMDHDLPWTAPEKFRALSPITHLPNATTPTMLMAGEADSRTPISEAEQAYACLQLQGVRSAFVRFPGATHSSGTMRPSHITAEITCTLAWLARYT
jgi:acylaminoacyl-peptidase